MAVPDYIHHPEVEKVMDELRIIRKDKPIRVSDVFDADGNQYVDLVQEGGGVLGIALVGYTYVMEEAGIRFRSLAGTSAGAINTVIMASAGPIQSKKARKILRYLATQDLFDLLDGNATTKRLIDGAIRGQSSGLLLLMLILNLRSLWNELSEKFGLNPGNKLQGWFREMMEDFGVRSTEDLTKKMGILPEGFQYRNPNGETENIDQTRAEIAVIASEVTTKTKVIFPKMSSIYWKEPDSVHPSEFIRASMSIPFFFNPYRINHLPNAGKPANDEWAAFAGYRGTIPRHALFVDGGMLSNFPINVFHRTDRKTPRMPTFGARLSNSRTGYSPNDSIFGFSGSMINTMRQLHDYDFLRKNAEYRQLICHIDANEKFNWLDFAMPDDVKQELFAHGCKKALEFLKKFDWEEYKKQRRKADEANAEV